MPSDLSMTILPAFRLLFDGDHKRIASVCQWKWRGRLRVPTPSPRRSPQGVPPPIPVEPEIGVLIRIESPPGVGHGILRIVRRSEIGDQGSG